MKLQTFTTFYPAVLFAALVGGAGPGVFAALRSGLVCWLYLLSPSVNPLPFSSVDGLNLTTFVIASAVIIWAADHYRGLTKRLRDEENLRRLAVDEMAHRLKNKVATIQSIITFRLRDQPEVGGEIARFLAALMATDDLISSSQGHGAYIRKILSAELMPYDLSRISMKGRNLLFQTKLALTFASLVHELATNVAKYGALSTPKGRLFVEWEHANGRLDLCWRESDGPPVSPPSHSGFGRRPFQRALEQFDGSLITEFAPSGLVCKLSVAIPESGRDDLTGASDKASEAVLAE